MCVCLEKSRGRIDQAKRERDRERKEEEGEDLTALYRSVKCKLLFMGPTG